MKRKHSFPSKQELDELLLYEPESGLLKWKITRSWNAKCGDIAGSLHKQSGYIQLSINNTNYHAHVLIWILMNGNFPETTIDHKNGNRKDNRFINLRLATRKQQSQNRMRQRNNSSGHIGVSWSKIAKKWRAYITVDRRQIHLGLFLSQNDAILAYEKAATVLFNDFYRKQS